MAEKWKDIKGHEGLYQVSNMGRVRSYAFISWNGKSSFIKRGKTLKIATTGGKARVSLYKGAKSKSQLVSRLVAIAFLPNRENKRCVCHKDDNPLNNDVKNLFWGTHQENMRDCIMKGRFNACKGEKHYDAKLTSKNVKIIKRLLLDGLSIREIAQQFFVHVATISDIKHKRTWKHITN